MNWLDKCKSWKEKWGYKKENFTDTNGIDLYYFTLLLSELLPEESCVVGTAGSSYYVSCQALRLKQNSKHIVTSGAEMGCGLGLAIGSCLARDKKDVILIEGDGSFNCAIDELSCVVANKLPIKIFVFNNNCYLSIRNTMKNMFDGRVFGTDNSNGLFVPSLKKISETYNIKYLTCSKHSELEEIIKFTLEYNGAIIIELKCNPNQVIHPGAGFKKDENGNIISLGLDRMSPQLNENEYNKEIIKL